jgi:hypothetical protein
MASRSGRIGTARLRVRLPAKKKGLVSQALFA